MFGQQSIPSALGDLLGEGGQDHLGQDFQHDHGVRRPGSISPAHRRASNPSSLTWRKECRRPFHRWHHSEAVGISAKSTNGSVSWTAVISRRSILLVASSAERQHASTVCRSRGCLDAGRCGDLGGAPKRFLVSLGVAALFLPSRIRRVVDCRVPGGMPRYRAAPVRDPPRAIWTRRIAASRRRSRSGPSSSFSGAAQASGGSAGMLLGSRRPWWVARWGKNAGGPAASRRRRVPSTIAAFMAAEQCGVSLLRRPALVMGAGATAGRVASGRPRRRPWPGLGSASRCGPRTGS